MAFHEKLQKLVDVSKDTATMPAFATVALDIDAEEILAEVYKVMVPDEEGVPRPFKTFYVEQKARGSLGKVIIRNYRRESIAVIDASEHVKE